MNDSAELPFPRFRDDLSIRERDGGGPGKAFSVYDPVSGERFELDERTFHLCEYFDGLTPPERIVLNFNERFGGTLTIDDLFRVFDELLALGLLTGTDPAAVSAFRGGTAEPPARLLTREGNREPPADRDRDDDGDDANEYRWPLFDPSGAFAVLSGALAPLRPLFLLVVYSLVVTLPAALFLFFENQVAMSRELARLGGAGSYFGRLIFSLFTLNLMRCLIQGTVIAYYGGRVKSFGIRLRFGIIPRFYIDKSAIRFFERGAKLWSYGSNLLFRMVLVVLGVGTWYLTRGAGNELGVHAIVVTHAALLSLILISLPLRSSDGYRWMVTYFRLPPNMIRMAVTVLVATVTRKPLPTSIAPAYRRRLLLYGVALILFWTYAFFRITTHVAEGLAASFPLLFGEATEIIVTAVVMLIAARWALTRFGRFHSAAGSSGGAADRAADRRALQTGRGSVPALAELDDLGLVPSTGAPAAETGEPPWIGRGVKLLALAALALFLALPYPFRPGGLVTLLPPEQQAIQAPVSGKIVEVLDNGGDGRLLTKGALVATMSSSTLEAAIATLAEQVTEQEAKLQKNRAILAKLLAGARKEEIDQAVAFAAQAAHEVALAERQLETAKVTWRYSTQELDRIRKLPPGVISDLEVSRSEKQAEVDRMHIAEYESNLAAKRKNAEEAAAALALLKSGASEQEIEVARQDVAAAEAELRRVQAELAHARSEASSGRLTIPFDGYLVDAYLSQKLGSYLSLGETYATAQTHRKPMVELQLPEYDAAEMKIGGAAEVRLLAYPSEPFAGRVVSIEPAGQPAEVDEVLGQVFKVSIELDDIARPVRPGMTGYAKVLVGEKPLFVIVTRPIVRFFQVEAWSWLP